VTFRDVTSPAYAQRLLPERGVAGSSSHRDALLDAVEPPDHNAA